MEKYRDAVLRYLHHHGEATRGVIMRNLRMRLNGIVAVCDALLASGEIRKEDDSRRRNVELRLVPEQFCAVGVEHLPDALLMVELDCSGKEVRRGEAPLERRCSGQGRLDAIIKVLDGFLAARAGRRVVALGMADVGMVDHGTGRSVYASQVEGWEDMPVKASLGERFAGLVEVMNRGDAGCFADRVKRREEAGDLIYVVVKGGIGASVLVGGEFLRERFPAAGEFGHMVVEKDGALCGCGKRGCLEAVAGPLAIARQAPGGVDWQEVVRGAESGDSHCARVLAEAGGRLGAGVAGMVCALGISRIILRSEVRDGGDIYLSAFEKALRGNLIPPLHRNLDVSSSVIDHFDGPRGAALLALHKYFNERRN